MHAGTMSSEVESSFLDTTLSSDDHQAAPGRRHGSHVTRTALEHRQLLHNAELLKLTVSMKENQLHDMQNAHGVQIEDLQEKLSDARHQCQLLQARLDYSTQAQRNEAEQDGKRVKAAEQSRADLQEHYDVIQSQLTGLVTVCDQPLLSAADFQRLKSRPVDRLAPSELLQVVMYEAVQPTLSEKDDLAHELNLAEQRARAFEEEAGRQASLAQTSEEQRQKVQTMFTELQAQLEKHVLAKMSAGKEHDFRVLNYDDVARERDAAVQQCQSLQSQVAAFESRLTEAVTDVSNMTEKLHAAEKQLELLNQDKSYLSQLIHTSKHQQHLAEDRLDEVRQQLQTSNATLDSMQNAVALEREQHRKDWSDRLEQELQAIKTQTSEEIQRIRLHSSEALERETRLMKDALERSQLERDHASKVLHEMEGKYQALLLDFQRVESTSQHQLSECQHELQLRLFELERIRLLHAGCADREEGAKLDAMKSGKRLELVKEELSEASREHERQVMRLEMDCRLHQQRLTAYAALEKELEDTLEEAAHGSGEEECEESSNTTHGDDGPALSPSTRSLGGQFATSRHWGNRLSVARRLLQSDRSCVSLRRQLAEQKEAVHRLTQEVDSSRLLLEQSHQPMSVLIKGMQARDDQLRDHNQELNSLRTELKHLHGAHGDLLKEKSDLMADLERLVHQQENFAQLRESITSLQQHRREARRKPEIGTSRSPCAELQAPLREAGNSAEHAGTSLRNRHGAKTATGHTPSTTISSPRRAVQQETIQSTDFSQLPQPDPTVFTKSGAGHKTKHRSKQTASNH